MDGSDYTLIDNAFNQQGVNLSASLAGLYAEVTAATASGGESVPEPSAIALLGLGTAGLLGRRRQRIMR